ncbi:MULTISPECIES: hypothetical protein [unclassified Leptolyngbya]|uniref:hypothetical protein n=1 Tax=unclassified Leptolyngbya TaxID=2650499 RepID=UPI00168A0F7B|nr:MULTISPECIES: hypothetical protein [unclassified Leptolyngbya]MBD1912918.1 hypothetical protein [Leptolyngbya sp. FACHB-8]MBD2154753.1 hypothetical protein [Leptolyngbya sp. FACHB-16]
MASDAQPSLPAEVSLTLLLEGGQQHTLKIASNNRLLQQLFETIVNRTDNRPQHVFQIPINNGAGVLCFAGERLVGIITEPPLIVQQPPAQEQTVPMSDPLAPGA